MIAQRLSLIRERIQGACQRVGRHPDAVRLLAVSKTQPASAVLAAQAAGQPFFGENRVMEARDKIAQLPGNTCQWHLIGPLQRNKVKAAVGLFQMIHTVDSFSLAQALSHCVVGTPPLPVLIQVNVGRETQKSGVAVEEAETLARAMAELPGIALRGLMAIPPMAPRPEETRPYFQMLAQLAKDIDTQKIPGITMTELSMGMSHDFEVAVEEGATWVRVGSALFGNRQQTNSPP